MKWAPIIVIAFFIVMAIGSVAAMAWLDEADEAHDAWADCPDEVER